MKLTPDNVYSVFRECFWQDADIEGLTQEEVLAKSVTAEGPVTKVAFCPEKVKEHKEKIQALLAELPDTFKEGMSFLEACHNKEGELWTGDHNSMEQLFILGLAIDQVKECLPRDLWGALPGGMPYYIVTPSPQQEMSVERT